MIRFRPAAARELAADVRYYAKHYAGRGHRFAAAVEAACEQARHQPLADMVRAVVEAFVDVKMERIDVSLALYQFAADVGGLAWTARCGLRNRRALGPVRPLEAHRFVERREGFESSPDITAQFRDFTDMAISRVFVLVRQFARQADV